ncbi:ATP-binding protein [Roseobacteraceae bacterium S113]
MISKLLIANRGEIACRIIRTCRDLGVATVAVYSDADAGAMHVEMADEAVRIGAASVAESYLRGDAIIEAARATGANAVHPGYGFLSENPDFVEAVEAAGLIFVGPSATAIRAMGLKDGAKRLMEAAGVPVVPGYHGAAQDVETLAKEAEAIGYPVLIKARAGGGGKGMRRVDRAEDFAAALEGAQREGQASFGDPACLIEKYIQSPRHIEMQVFGDATGAAIHLFERDCSLQRRHQKVIEEAPAPGMTDAVRAAMGAAAVAAAQAVGYQGAGTVEFIADGSGPLRADGFWFMEMNTRLQVEHPVTEAITGLDLVALQIAVAEGQPLPLCQEDVRVQGHAFEARLYAEDAAAGFLPATGPLDVLSFSAGARNDTGVRAGDAVTPHYDPMIAKIITHGPDRASALRRLTRALGETHVAGCTTNRAFLQALSRDADFAAGQMDTGLIERRGGALIADATPTALDLALGGAVFSAGPGAVLDHFRHFGPATREVRLADAPVDALRMVWDGRTVTAEIAGATLALADVDLSDTGLSYSRAGQRHHVRLHRNGHDLHLQFPDRDVHLALAIPGAGDEAGGGDAVTAPMPGRVIALMAQVGDRVEKGAPLLVLEAMKMEHTLTAPRAGSLAQITVGQDDQVSQGALLVQFDPET